MKIRNFRLHGKTQGHCQNEKYSRLAAHIFLCGNATRNTVTASGFVPIFFIVDIYLKFFTWKYHIEEALIPASLSGMYLSAAQACKPPLEYPTTQNLSFTPTASAKSNISIAEDSRFLLG